MTKTYIETIGVKPTGTYYSFTQTEIDKLVVDFVENRTGFELDLTVGCLDENYDVYISWNDGSEAFTTTYQSFEDDSSNPIGISTEEDFMNRDNIFQEIFGVTAIGYECNFDTVETEYTLFIPNN